MQRKTINLDDSLAEKVLLFFASESPEHVCLHELMNEELDSESDVLQALVALGVRAVEERQLEEGYAAWAAAWDEEDEAWSEQSMREFAERVARDDD